jgi:hypothetical protein
MWNFAIANSAREGYLESAAQKRTSKMDQGAFQEGYAAGWRSVTGRFPIIIPPSPMRNDTDAFMVGFSRGKRDADAMATESPIAAA